VAYLSSVSFRFKHRFQYRGVTLAFGASSPKCSFPFPSLRPSRPSHLTWAAWRQGPTGCENSGGRLFFPASGFPSLRLTSPGKKSRGSRNFHSPWDAPGRQGATGGTDEGKEAGQEHRLHARAVPLPLCLFALSTSRIGPTGRSAPSPFPGPSRFAWRALLRLRFAPGGPFCVCSIVQGGSRK